MKEIIDCQPPANLSKKLDAIGEDEKTKLDANAKLLLADKQVLSYILKYTTKEFQNYTLEEIWECIEDEPDVGKRVEPGMTNGHVSEEIHGEVTENYIPHEGEVFFDIVFRVRTMDAAYEIIINVEAQNSSKPSNLGYHIETRMVYYICRLVSSQKMTEFEKSHYDDLKKVKSIWICMDSEEDSIISHFLKTEVIFGEPSESEISEIDLIEGIMIRIRTTKKVKESKDALIRMLEHLFSDHSIDEKKQMLEQDGLKMTAEFRRKVENMCNYSDLVERNARAEGKAVGRAEGRAEERKKNAKEFYNNDVPIEVIARSLHETIDQIKEWVLPKNLV